MSNSVNKRSYCKSLQSLSDVAEKFVNQNDNLDKSMKELLQDCIDTLSNYQSEIKKLKKLQDNPKNEDHFTIYEMAFVYFKIVSQIVLNKIPNLHEYTSSKSVTSKQGNELLEIYNLLVKRLVTDQKIGEVKKFIRDNSKTDDICDTSNEITHKMVQNNLNTYRNGDSIDSISLKQLINSIKKVLLIDLRPRVEFIKSHIKHSSVICIEPVSFKDSYSDLDVFKKSLITSPNAEIKLFEERDQFDYIVIYTVQEEKFQYYSYQQKVLLDLLLNKSFDKPLNHTILLILKGGFTTWKDEIDQCENIHGDNIYLNGDASGLNFMDFTQMMSNFTLNSDVNQMLGSPFLSNYDTIGNTQYFPSQQQPKSKKSSNLKDFFVGKSDKMTIPSERISKAYVTDYPEAPQLINNNFKSLPGSPMSHITTKASILSSKDIASTECISTPQRIKLSPEFLSPYSIMSDNTFPLSPQLSHHLQSTSFESIKIDEFSVGLVNTGNSCYMNCIIQCLLGTIELCQIFLNNSYKSHINLKSRLGSKGVLARYFSQLIHMMYQQGRSFRGKEEDPVVPVQFKLACGSINSLFKDRSQQDCQEFCQFILDGLHEDLNQCGNNPPLKPLSDEAEKMRETMTMRVASSIEWERYLTTDFSVIIDLFQGQYASQLKCKICCRTSTTYQPFSVLSIPIPQPNTCSILDCFNEFTKLEVLGNNELWLCPKCKQRQPSTKKITITRLPKNLIIHLKRFDNTMNKNNCFVNYPTVLDLTQFWANDYENSFLVTGGIELPRRGQVPPFYYKLYGVASHTGTLYGGHYTAYVDKGSRLGWCFYDDTIWRKVKNPQEYITQNAYVLFYHRVHNI